jgi:hypothetical protein
MSAAPAPAAGGAPPGAAADAAAFQSLNLTSYVSTLPPATRSELYASPWTCQAIFRELAPLAQQYVLRLLYAPDAVADGARPAGGQGVDWGLPGKEGMSAARCAARARWRAPASRRPGSQRRPLLPSHVARRAPPRARAAGYVRNWARADTTAAKKHEAALKQLRELSLLTGDGRGCGQNARAGGRRGRARRRRAAAPGGGPAPDAAAPSPPPRSHPDSGPRSGAAGVALNPVFKQRLRSALAGGCAAGPGPRVAPRWESPPGRAPPPPALMQAAIVPSAAPDVEPAAPSPPTPRLQGAQEVDPVVAHVLPGPDAISDYAVKQWEVRRLGSAPGRPPALPRRGPAPACPSFVWPSNPTRHPTAQAVLTFLLDPLRQSPPSLPVGLVGAPPWGAGHHGGRLVGRPPRALAPLLVPPPPLIPTSNPTPPPPSLSAPRAPRRGGARRGGGPHPRVRRPRADGVGVPLPADGHQQPALGAAAGVHPDSRGGVGCGGARGGWVGGDAGCSGARAGCGRRGRPATQPPNRAPSLQPARLYPPLDHPPPPFPPPSPPQPPSCRLSSPFSCSWASALSAAPTRSPRWGSWSSASRHIWRSWGCSTR